MQRPVDQDAVNAADPAAELLGRFPDGTDLGAELLALLGTPTIADKSWVWHQYDHQLFLNTVVGPGGDAAVLRLKGTSRALALATDGKGRFCRLDPRLGGRLVVLEAARNVSCAGARARALVNKPEIVWADEPTGALDSKTADDIMSLMEQLNREQGLTFVIVTHDPGVGARCNRIERHFAR